MQRDHAANVAGKDGFAVQLDVLAALRGGASGNSVVDHAEVVEGKGRFLGGPRAKGLVQRTGTRGEILGAQRGVHAAIDGPIKSVAQDRTLAGGSTDAGNQESALTAQLLDRRRGIWKIENRNALQAKRGIEKMRLIADANHNSLRGKGPFRMRHFTRRYRAM